MPLSLKLVTPPAAEPVTLALAKSQCRVSSTFTGDDALFAVYITAARQYVEKQTGRAIFNQTWVRTLDHFPLWWSADGTVNPQYRGDWPYYSDFWNRITIDVPFPGTQSVSSITYLDLNNVEQTLDPAAYVVDLSSEPARIVPAQGTYWPDEMTYVPGSVAITFVAGTYGDGVTVNNCPMTTVQAILLLVSHWYEHRVGVDGTMQQIPLGIDSLLTTEWVTTTFFRPL